MDDLTRVRNPDYDTSIDGAISVRARADAQQLRLLHVFRQAGSRGLTDDEAGEKAGLLDSCYWKRCGELRRKGLIRNTGQKRKGLSGVLRIVSSI